MSMKTIRWVLAAMLLAGAGCKSAYYGAMETVGVHKRDILVDRVEGAVKDQREAQETFKTTLELFSEVVDIQADELESAYNKLNKSYEASVKKADDVRSRIAAIESVSKSLFKEWKSEIKQYSNADLKRKSQAQYDASTKRYKQMIDKMNAAASRMDPVLSAFNDQVLFMKHNLNSAAISSLENEVVRIESSVDGLIQEMEEAIAEAEAFLREWSGT